MFPGSTIGEDMMALQENRTHALLAKTALQIVYITKGTFKRLIYE